MDGEGDDDAAGCGAWVGGAGDDVSEVVVSIVVEGCGSVVDEVVLSVAVEVKVARILTMEVEVTWDDCGWEVDVLPVDAAAGMVRVSPTVKLVQSTPGFAVRSADKEIAKPFEILAIVSPDETM